MQHYMMLSYDKGLSVTVDSIAVLTASGTAADFAIASRI